MIPKTFNRGSRRSSKTGRGRTTRKSYGVQAELKSLDLNSNLASNSTGAISLLNGCAQGSDLHERIGRQIHEHILQIDGMLHCTAATGVDQYLRYLVVQDSQSNGTALSITDVLDTVSITSHANVSNLKRFRIVLDHKVYLNASGEPGSGKVVSHSLSLGSTVYFNVGNAGTVADITKNSLYLIVIGSIAPGATAGSGDFQTRIRFSDE
jgi:hypothetical protein